MIMAAETGLPRAMADDSTRSAGEIGPMGRPTAAFDPGPAAPSAQPLQFFCRPEGVEPDAPIARIEELVGRLTECECSGKVDPAAIDRLWQRCRRAEAENRRLRAVLDAIRIEHRPDGVWLRLLSSTGKPASWRPPLIAGRLGLMAQALRDWGKDREAALNGADAEDG